MQIITKNLNSAEAKALPEGARIGGCYGGRSFSDDVAEGP